MIKPAFCLFGLLGISHLFLADKRALIWRSQDTGVSVSVVTGLVYRNHSFLLSCLTPSLLFKCWRPRGNPPIGGSPLSPVFSVVQWMQISPSRPVFVLTGAACNHSPKRPNSPLSETFSACIFHRVEVTRRWSIVSEAYSNVFNYVIML